MSQRDQFEKTTVSPYKQELPLMDIDKFRSELVDWLSQMELPKNSPVSSWAECIKVFGTTPEDATLNEGIKLRISLQLNTFANKYLISFLESMELDSRGVYILAVHVNWKDSERGMQQMVERGYKGDFDDILRSSHVIWIQTFLDNELKLAMNSAAISILSHELTGTASKQKPGEPLKRPAADKVNFPSETTKEVDGDSAE